MGLKRKIIGEEFLSLNESNRQSTPHIQPKDFNTPFNLPKGRNSVSVRNTRPCKVFTMLDSETKQKLDMIKVLSKLDSQDFIYAAIKDFMQRYADEHGVTEEGRGVITRLIAE